MISSFKGRLNIGGQFFRIAQAGLIILLLSTSFVGNWFKAIDAVEGAVLRCS